ncbi:release factor glutamine methyltransferase [Thermodesulfomicrobium sp. WS]|uniref:peptide chain release factor N(5)-glutamine methyltransferase n=1 Tax=Thermodesulfomicrobium sp. WS TaxID=3004129 RepID=UPI0024930FA4|nr:peptide chain release factor N(5)-glutamine methyltransferase [Thermodesulfomicrobium sp. WS]BDV00107.1 release factor glutamine methyltransferase [Thermodesulfomicrobium sp. WS]
MARIAEILAYWEGRFMEAGVDSPRLSAQVLLAHVLGVDRIAVLLERAQHLSAEVEASMAALAIRRLRGEPVAYLVGEKEFYGLPLTVSPAVLIPRPETEGIVDVVRRHVPADVTGWVVDVGTGSGALAVALATVLPQARVLGTDTSAAALQVAAGNVRRHRLEGRVCLARMDLVSGVNLARCTVLVANLPYVPQGRELSREVLHFEPHIALFAGADGLEAYRRLLPQLGGMSPGALVVCEVDASHAEAALALVPGRAQHAWVELDLAGRPRYLIVVF